MCHIIIYYVSTTLVTRIKLPAMLSHSPAPARVYVRFVGYNCTASNDGKHITI